MGDYWKRAQLMSWTMQRTNDKPKRCQQSASRSRPPPTGSRGDPSSSALHPPEDHDLVMFDLSSPGRTTNNLTEKQEATEEPPCPGRVPIMSTKSRAVSKSPNNSSYETAKLELERTLKETKARINELRSSQEAQNDRIRSLTTNLDSASRFYDEFQAASGHEVQGLKSNVEEKVKDLEAEKIHTSQLNTRIGKLEAQLALVEQKAAQESRTSGSYSDDHANPGMLEGACKDVDKATENLARLLHNNSVTKVLPLESPELKQFVRLISPANPEDFSRAIQVKYAWSYWICRQMFEGFEHVFFDADGGLLTSPLDSKSHALECFRLFQQKHNGFSSGLFEAFCSRKLKSMFLPWLVNQAFIPTGITCNENGRFPGDEALHAQFMVVARAVWSLHQLAFSFDPPASILRMAREMPYDHQYHESVVHVEGGPGMSSQMVSLMVRPAFRVRKSVIRGRVFLCDNPNRPKQA